MVSVRVVSEGRGVVMVIAVVETTTDVTVVTLVPVPADVVEGPGMMELPDAVLLLTAVDVKSGVDEVGAVPVPQVEEAVPELLPKGAEVSYGGGRDEEKPVPDETGPVDNGMLMDEEPLTSQLLAVASVEVDPSVDVPLLVN